jgi:FkbM family methyltransferase
MKQKLKKYIKKAISPFWGTYWTQPIYSKLLYFAMRGMHIGEGTAFDAPAEHAALKHLKTILRINNISNPTIFDVGANVGGYTTLLKNVFGDNCYIHSFEASPNTMEELQRTHSNSENVSLWNLALSNSSGVAPLFSTEGNSGLSSLHYRHLTHHGITLTEECSVNLQTLDDFCSSEGIDNIHFLKLDTEGHELAILQGASRMLSENKIDAIQFEFGGCNIDSRTFFRDFFNLLHKDYSIFRLVRNGLYPVNEYSEFCEIFSCTNFMAISRRLRSR